MGRAKASMKFISNEKARNMTYEKRRNGLIKKGRELSILCNVPVCIIIYPYKQGIKSLEEAQVFAYKGDGTGDSASSGKDNPNVAKEILEMYTKVPLEDRVKRATTLYDLFDNLKKKAHQELCKLRCKNALTKYPTWDPTFDGLNTDNLRELVVYLGKKIEFVRQRIDMIKDNQATTTTTTTDLVPYIDPKPIYSVMMPSDNNGPSQMRYPEFEGHNNECSLLNYSNNSQEYYYQNIMPFNQVMGAPRIIDEHGASTSSNNFVMYNMNMLGPMYYDQKLGFVEDGVGAATPPSYGVGLPMPPLHLPNNNVPLPMQKPQYQMLYDYNNNQHY